jgi:thymidylate synthase
MTQFDHQYQAVLKEVLENGSEQFHQRTNHQIISSPGLTLEITAGLPLLTLRKIPLKAFVAEQVWFLTGSNQPESFLRRFTKIWDSFTEEDGTVAAAYGYRWRYHFGRDQINLLIKHLTREPSSRQGVVMIWDPAEDSLESSTPKKNNPCPLGFVVNIIGGWLNFHLMIRSSDIILGLPQDVAGFAFLQRLLAAKLKARVGKMTVSLSHAHIYDVHYQAAYELVNRDHNHAEIELQVSTDDFDRAEKGDESLVKEIVDNLLAQYDPLPALKLAPVVVGEAR